MTKLAHKKEAVRRAHIRLATGSRGRKPRKAAEPAVHDELRDLMRHAYMHRMAMPPDHPHT